LREQVATLRRWVPVLPQWRVGALFASAESFLDREREALPLWWVVALGSGVALWLILPGSTRWTAVLWIAAGVTVGARATSGRVGKVLSGGAIAVLLGLSLIWWRSEQVATSRLDRPSMQTVVAVVERVEAIPTRDLVRLVLRTQDPALPPRIRVNADVKNVPDSLGAGSTVRLKARLTGPMNMPLPGAHDYARDAWFAGIGAIGKALGPVDVMVPGETSGLDRWRADLDRHIRAQLDPSAGGIATALATGDQNALPQADAEAMRRSGLAHLLSVSGLHIAAAIGAAFLISLHLLSLSERLAVRFNLVLAAAAVGALAGIAYTVLTGLQVPTVRSCIAALLVLVGIALGREAISLRMIGTGALLVLLFRPEALYGASFQLSFAAVTTLVALFSWPWFKRLVETREEGAPIRILRKLAELLMTGVAIELALLPFALYHFHKAGIYGVVANLIAIPLTTFVIMPLEAGALLLDLVGWGGPLWQLTGISIGLLLTLAHTAADAPGSVALLPAMPGWAFGMMVVGGLWLALWRDGRTRTLGLMPILVGVTGAAMAPVPDLLLTGDGRHLAVIADDGTPHILRERAGDFVRDMLGEGSAFEGELPALDDWSAARCSRDSCWVQVERGGRSWKVLALRSGQRLDWAELVQWCAAADLVIADRRLPRACQPRWLRLDAPALRQTGGVVIHLREEPVLSTVADQTAGHPWSVRP